MAPKELKAIHPLGKAPIITDHGKAIAESGAIVEYLLQTHSSTPPSFNLSSNYYSHYSEGTLMLFLQQITTWDALATMAPWYVRPVIAAFVAQIKSIYFMKEVQKNVTFLEEELKKTPHGWFGGDESPSAGDYMMLYPVQSLLTSEKFSSIKFGDELRNWMKAVEARPAYQRGLKRLNEEEAKGREAEKQKL